MKVTKIATINKNGIREEVRLEIRNKLLDININYYFVDQVTKDNYLYNTRIVWEEVEEDCWGLFEFGDAFMNSFETRIYNNIVYLLLLELKETRMLILKNWKLNKKNIEPKYFYNLKYRIYKTNFDNIKKITNYLDRYDEVDQLCNKLYLLKKNYNYDIRIKKNNTYLFKDLETIYNNAQISLGKTFFKKGIEVIVIYYKTLKDEKPVREKAILRRESLYFKNGKVKTLKNKTLVKIIPPFEINLYFYCDEKNNLIFMKENYYEYL